MCVGMPLFFFLGVKKKKEEKRGMLTGIVVVQASIFDGKRERR
jgi:hypothetical protein